MLAASVRAIYWLRGAIGGLAREFTTRLLPNPGSATAEDEDREPPLGTVLHLSECLACGRHFVGIAGFRRHRLTEDLCHHPDDVGLVPYVIDGSDYWGTTTVGKESNGTKKMAEGGNDGGPERLG